MARSTLLLKLAYPRFGGGQRSENEPGTMDSTHLDPAHPAPRPASEPLHDPRSLGEFRILRRLGEGGMGSVYLAYHEELGQQVAIKVLSEHMTGNQVLVDRFYREAKSGALLNHPNIVRTMIVGQDQATGKHYLVLEYIDGPSAHALLDKHGRTFAAELGIRLEKAGPAALFRLLCMAKLLSARIGHELAMRAAALYPEVSELLGVRTGVMLGLGWGLASAVGAISGILVAPRILLEPNMMQGVIIYAFAAAVMGGIDSPVGAVVGGLALGVMLALIGAYLPALADLRLALSLLLIVVLLVVRPSGLFGQHQARRV